MEGNLPSPNFDSHQSSGFLPFSSTPIQGSNFKPKWGKKNRADNWAKFGKSQEDSGSPNSRSPGYRNNSNNFSGERSWNQGNNRGSPGGYNVGNNRGSPGGYNTGNNRGSPGGYNTGNNRGSPGGYYGGNNRGSPGGYNQGNNRGSPGGYNSYGSSPAGRNYGNPRPGNFHRGNSQRKNNMGRNQWNSSGSENSSGLFHPSMIEDPWRELENSLKYKEQTSFRTGMAASSDSMIPQVGTSLLQRNKELNETECD